MPNSKEIETIMKAAEHGDVVAQKNLGKCYYDGDGVEQSYKNAVEWFTKAAEQGNASAQNKLGVCFHLGQGVEQNDKIAAEWIQRSAEQGYAKAQCNLGIFYMRGDGVPKNKEIAVEWIKKAAEQGNTIAQLKMGDCYANGEVVVKNVEKAAEWYAKATEQGNARAQYELACFYSRGIGVAKDERKAFELLSLSANQGYCDSQLDVGYCYEFGKGVRKNLKKAVEWYEKSAIQGNPIALTNLGYCYEKGLGTIKDNERAAERYAKAVEQGNARAMNNLGLLYEQGLGVEKNVDKALDLYLQSALQGYVSAFTNLGHCYEYGIGISRNYKDAEIWYSKAAAMGNQYSKKALKRVKEKIKDEEWFKSLNFSTRQKVRHTFYSRVIPFGKNYIVKRKNLWGIVDKNENILLPIEYTRVHWFDGGYAGIQTNNLWGLVNSEGLISIEPQYETLHYLSQYKACEVEKEGVQFVVDVGNNVILKLEGKNVRFDAGKLVARSRDGWQLYNFDGTPFSKIHPIIRSIGDKFMAYDDGNETIIKLNGEEVKLPSYEMGTFLEHITPFRYQDKYGIIDENAVIVVPNKYDYITLGDGIIAINEGNKSKDQDRFFFAHPQDGKWYFWNYQFQEITPFKYERMSNAYKNDYEHIWFGAREGRWYQISPEGETLFANNEAEYKKKKEKIERNRRKITEGYFVILEDPNYKEDGRKLFVRACDGKCIRNFYYTPYLPMPMDELKAHWKVGESFVNIYGQDMPNPHAFKMPKHKKPRYVFKLNSRILNLEKKDLIGLFVNLLRPSGLENKQIINLYAVFQTKQKRAILCEWLLRKFKRNKNVKFEYDELVSLITPIENWVKKHI